VASPGRATPPSQPWRDCVGAGPSGPFPATASAEGAQFNMPPFPATASAEGRLIKGGPSPARGEGEEHPRKIYVPVLSREAA